MAPKGGGGSIGGRDQPRTALHSKLFGPSAKKRSRPSCLDQPGPRAQSQGQGKGTDTSKAKAKAKAKAKTTQRLAASASISTAEQQQRQADAGEKLRSLLLRRNLSPAAAGLLALSLLPMQPARQRSLLCELGRLPEMVAEANDSAQVGSLCATALLQKIDEEVRKRQADLLRQIREAQPLGGKDELKLDCPECNSDSAKGSLFNSAAGSKPMLGRARIVTRGSCPQCGHVWIVDE